MVSESHSDVQRRDRRRAPRNMGASYFFHLAAAPRPYRNSGAHLAAYAKHPRIRGVDRPNSSSLNITPLFVTNWRSIEVAKSIRPVMAFWQRLMDRRVRSAAGGQLWTRSESSAFTFAPA